jgi:pyridoxamine 5'-phosphate oxidase
MLAKGGESIVGVAANSSSATASWISRLLLTIDKNSGQIPGLFLQLSTIGIDGSPRCRTVVCRRVDRIGDSHGRLLVCTSMISDKWAELKQNPHWEICWYFSHTREQYRLRGDIIQFFHLPVHTEAQEIWDTMSTSAKEMFTKASPSSPSATSSNGNTTAEATEQRHYETFGVLSFSPKFIQLLELVSGNITTW